MTSYTTKTLLISLLACGLLAWANWTVNPYLLFDAPVRPGVNHFITENYYKQLVFKPYQLRTHKPVSLILGASQAGVAFNPDRLPQPAYNLAVGGSTSYIQHRLLQEAYAANPALDQVIFETAFLAFNDSDPNNIPEHDKNLENRLTVARDGTKHILQPFYAAQEKLSGLVSWETTRASMRTGMKQKDIESKHRGSFIQWRNGQWAQQPAPGNRTRITFENSWKKALFNDWQPAPSHQYTLAANDKGPFLFFRQSLQLLYQKKADATIVIAPMHASLFAGLQAADLLDTYQQWKIQLVTINEEEAARSGNAPFPVYDYAVINSLTTENIPAAEATRPMTWFNDSLHPSPAYGDLVLAEILTNQPVHGKQLNLIHAAQAEQEERIQLQAYLAAHPDITVAMKHLVNKTTRP